MDKIFETLKEGKYRIIFRWIDKKTYAKINTVTKNITTNLELWLATMYAHEWHHGEDHDLPKKVKEEEALVGVRENEYIRRRKIPEIKELARYIEKHKLLPQLIKKHMPELLKEYTKQVRKSERKRKKKEARLLVLKNMRRENKDDK